MGIEILKNNFQINDKMEEENYDLMKRFEEENKHFV
jgi:hypothetical protein